MGVQGTPFDIKAIPDDVLKTLTVQNGAKVVSPPNPLHMNMRLQIP